MRRSLIFVLPLVIVVAGCGGGKKTTGSTAGSNPNAVTVTTNGQTLTLSGGTAECDAKQITAGAFREGSCAVYGVTVTFVDKTHWLHRREYDVHLQGVRTASGPNGTFAVVTLSVRNKGSSGLAFDRHSDLVFLTVNKTIYDERHDAEKARSDSFVRRGTAIAPGGAATGTVVFDIPADQAQNVSAATNNLVFVNIADEGASPAVPPKTMGYIRLWK